MFKIIDGKGFHITFPNGVMLSTQIGYGNYCENRDKIEFSPVYRFSETKQINHVSALPSMDSEIAIFDKDKNWITEKYLRSIGESEDMVIGYVDQEQWFKIFDWCRSYKHE